MMRIWVLPMMPQNLRSHFGPNTYINLHVEPLKVNGEYVEPVKGKKKADAFK